MTVFNTMPQGRLALSLASITRLQTSSLSSPFSILVIFRHCWRRLAKPTCQSPLDPASNLGDRERKVVTKVVLCRREGVERMVVKCAGVKSRASFSATVALKVLADGEMEDRRESREEELHMGELRMMEEVEAGEVKRRGSK